MIEIEELSNELSDAIKEVYKACSLHITDFKAEPESQEYKACRFKLNGKGIIYREAKITPKKIGQFVTFWKRNEQCITAPFSDTENFDFHLVNVSADNRAGQFVFPKAVLIQKGIVSTEKKDGKRGFRVYPPWDVAENKQAILTQKWQSAYFLDLRSTVDTNHAKELYSNHL